MLSQAACSFPRPLPFFSCLSVGESLCDLFFLPPSASSAFSACVCDLLSLLSMAEAQAAGQRTALRLICVPLLPFAVRNLRFVLRCRLRDAQTHLYIFMPTNEGLCRSTSFSFAAAAPTDRTCVTSSVTIRPHVRTQCAFDADSLIFSSQTSFDSRFK